MKPASTRSRRNAIAHLCSIGGSLVLGLAMSPAYSAEKALAPEKNPPGDIPDTQAFVEYSSPLGFALKVPEGWARAERHDGVRFADKFNSVDVSVGPAPGAGDVASVNTLLVAQLVASGHAVSIVAISAAKLPAGSAVWVAYTDNSETNPVVAKRLRLEHHRYLIQRGNRLAALDLSAPLGADNADQWSLMARSFRWN